MNMITLFFLIILIGSMWVFPTATFMLGITLLLFSLAKGIHAIFQKHKESQNPRLHIGKDTLILVFTILLISFLSGVAGLLTNHYVSNSFGAVAGLICAILIGFVIGYLVRRGVMKLTS